MDTTEWFDKGTYSDLTLQLSDGTHIKVHKIILCNDNDYFRRLCGAESQFSESKQAIIELKDDDPVALTVVLRHIYKFPIVSEAAHTRTWREWLNIHTTADKYLEPDLSKTANKHFRRTASASTDSDDIFDIIELIENEMAHDESLITLSNEIRTKNWSKRLMNNRFRAKFESGGTEALWRVIGDLAFAADLTEKRLFICGLHQDMLFDERRYGGKATEWPCSICAFSPPERSRRRRNVMFRDEEVLELAIWGARQRFPAL